MVSIELIQLGLAEVRGRDLLHFTELECLDASENCLQLADFGELPALKQLILRVNQIEKVAVPPGCFPGLEHLDLSFNNLSISPGTLPALSRIPLLTELHLGQNSLEELPGHWANFDHLRELDLEAGKHAAQPTKTSHPSPVGDGSCTA